jgi:hypothetical protein
VTSINEEARRKRDKRIPSPGPIDSSLSIFGNLQPVKVHGVVLGKAIHTRGIADIGSKTVEEADSGKSLSGERD